MTAARAGRWTASVEGKALLRLDRPVVLAFVASRVVIVAAAVLSEFVLSRNGNLTSGDSAPILRSLTSWDGWWFLGIARDGYHAAATASGYHDYAFLPLYPLLVRVVSAPWPAFMGLAAVLVSNLLCLVALGLLVRLGEPYVGRERAVRAAAYLAIFPFAFVFAMSYSESLFLCLVVGAFLAAERRYRAAAALLLALACLTRLQGLVLIVPLALIMLRQDGWRLRLSQAWLVLAPLAAAAFIVYVQTIPGSTGLSGAQADWGRVGIGSSPAGGSLATGLSAQNLANLVILCVGVFPLMYVPRDRIALPYALVPVLLIASVFASGLLESIGRYLAVAFPFGWILASRRSARFHVVWPAVSLALMAVASLFAFRGYFVP